MNRKIWSCVAFARDINAFSWVSLDLKFLVRWALISSMTVEENLSAFLHSRPRMFQFYAISSECLRVCDFVSQKYFLFPDVRSVRSNQKSVLGFSSAKCHHSSSGREK